MASMSNDQLALGFTTVAACTESLATTDRLRERREERGSEPMRARRILVTCGRPRL
jgi:hypothetical protein